MMTQHNRSINVKRSDLLLALHSGLEAHRTQYAEAVQDFRTKVLRDLKAKTKEVTKATDAQLVKIGSPFFTAPMNHEQEYLDMIDLFEVSVDELINLDHQSFKSFFKNEWPWKHQFETSAMSYKA